MSSGLQTEFGTSFVKLIINVLESSLNVWKFVDCNLANERKLKNRIFLKILEVAREEVKKMLNKDIIEVSKSD